MTRTLLAAAALVAAATTGALADPGGPTAGPCHVYFHDPVISDVPGTPYLYCDY